MFPRYVFVYLDPEKHQWRAIRSTVGVYNFLSHGNKPIPVPAGVIDSIRYRENDQGLVIIGGDQCLNNGDKVRVTHGPMADKIGIFNHMDDQDRVFLLLDIMGREVRVRVSREVVAAL